MTEETNRRVLAAVAHPDDIEFLMAGSLLRLRDAGYEIHFWTLANGCCGSDRHDAAETARMRRDESMAAAKQLGAVYHEPLCNDLEVFYDKETLKKVASVIREIAPSIVLTHSTEDYMEDHTNTARLVVTGTFARGMRNFAVEPQASTTYQSVCVYHAQPYSNLTPLRKLVVPDIFVDTTDLLEKKKKLLACHASQKEWLDLSQGVDSYLSALESLDRQVGEMSGQFELAEGWRPHLYPGFAQESDDFLTSALSTSGQAESVLRED